MTPTTNTTPPIGFESDSLLVTLFVILFLTLWVGYAAIIGRRAHRLGLSGAKWFVLGLIGPIMADLCLAATRPRAAGHPHKRLRIPYDKDYTPTKEPQR
jgi:uncharacterized membrane protein YhaH (DUF805 family)